MKLFAYTQNGVVKPSSSAPANAAPPDAPRKRLVAKHAASTRAPITALKTEITARVASSRRAGGSACVPSSASAVSGSASTACPAAFLL